jgi:dipeptidyl-peptidase-4
MPELPQMKINRSPSLLARCLLLLALLASMPVCAGDPPMSLDIDGLYAEPSLIGTRPSGASWSPGSNRIAFLWNEQGGKTKDVWTWSPGEKKPQRLTLFGSDRSNETTGVSEVAWLNDHRLVYVHNDALFQQKPGESGGVELLGGAGLRHVTPSPDGRSLGYVSNEGLWLFSLEDENAEPVNVLAHADPANRISDFQWSKDSTLLAFSQTDYRPLPEREIHYETREGHQVLTVRRAFPGEDTAHYRIGLIETETGSTSYLERPDDREYIWNYGLSANGKRLFVNGSDLLVKHHRIDVYDLDSGKRSVFYQEHDPLHLRPDWRAAWAPDDDGLIILTDRDGYLHLYHQADAKAEPRALTTGEWEIASFQVDSAGEWVYFLANRSHLADKQIYRVPFAGGQVEQVSPDSHGTHQPVFSPDMRQAVSLFSDDRTPHELIAFELASRNVTSITNSPLPGFYQQQWADVRYVEFPSRVDGMKLLGRLSLPPDFDPERRYPLIVGSVYSDSVLNQWGGRQSHPTWGLDQYLVAQGYILLNVNIRGSWGQGREHNQGLRHGYGIVDIEDLHSGVALLPPTWRMPIRDKDG